MIKTKKDLSNYLSADAQRNGIKSKFDYWAKLLYGNESAHAFRYLKAFRMYEYYSNINSPLRFFLRYYHRRLGLKYRLAIPINTVGPGIYIPHFQGGVVINCKSIGCNFIISSGCIIGNKDSQENRAIIGDNVELCIGSKVIGKVVIGDNVIVAPNSVVIKDIPSNCVVSGVPAKIIKQDGKKIL